MLTTEERIPSDIAEHPSVSKTHGTGVQLFNIDGNESSSNMQLKLLS